MTRFDHRRYSLFATKTKGEPDRDSHGVAGSCMDPECRRTVRVGTRLNVVLRFVVRAICQIVDRKIKIEVLPDSSNKAEIDDAMASGDDGGILTVKAVVIDGTQP